MAPLVHRQLGIFSLLSDLLPSPFAPAASTEPVTRADPALTPARPQPTVSSSVESPARAAPSPTSTLAAQVPVNTPILVTTFTTTTEPLTSTTPVVTSSSSPPPTTSTSSSSTTPVPTATPVRSTNVVSASREPTPPPSGTAAGVETGSPSSSNKTMNGGIIALIVIGALLGALLASAFIFRRVQVYRRRKRRENNYGAGPISNTSPFPFTNVAEADMRGAESIRDLRQGSVTTLGEKPAPSIASVAPTYPNGRNQTGMSGPYPTMGQASGYGYDQPDRTTPVPSQPARMMSPASPPSAMIRTGSPAFPVSATRPFSQPVTPAIAPAPTPVSALAPPVSDFTPPSMRMKRRVVQTFQPSLPDELSIREGDWVTIIHTYDDGWGLCDCNGRRGVVPLECLELGMTELRTSRRLSSLSTAMQ